MIVLDTDHLSLLRVRDAPAAFAFEVRLEAFSPGEVGTTVIAMEEQVRIGTMDLKIAVIALGRNALCCPAICAIFSRSLV